MTFLESQTDFVVQKSVRSSSWRGAIGAHAPASGWRQHSSAEGLALVECGPEPAASPSFLPSPSISGSNLPGDQLEREPGAFVHLPAG